MPEDPDEIKVKAIKRSQQFHRIQKYMEEQEALDAAAPGKMGAHQVTTDPAGNVCNPKMVSNALKGKSRK